MGPLPMILKSCVRSVSIGIPSTLMLVTIAHGQVSRTSVQPRDSDSATPAPGTRAESLTYGADVGIGESDNVTLVQTDKVSQTIAIADLDFDLKDQTRRFDVDAKGTFSDLDYLQGAYSNQLIGRFDGRADVALIPDRVIWVLTDSFGQAQIDPFTADGSNQSSKHQLCGHWARRYLQIGTDGFLGLERPLCKDHLPDGSLR